MMLLGSMRAEERLATFLLNLSKRFTRRGYSPSDFHLRMTREDIGSFLGLKLETVSRLFSKFQEEGLIEVHQKHVRIRDLAGLEAVLGNDRGSERQRASRAVHRLLIAGPSPSGAARCSGCGGRAPRDRLPATRRRAVSSEANAASISAFRAAHALRERMIWRSSLSMAPGSAGEALDRSREARAPALALLNARTPARAPIALSPFGSRPARRGSRRHRADGA